MILDIIVQYSRGILWNFIDNYINNQSLKASEEGSISVLCKCSNLTVNNYGYEIQNFVILPQTKLSQLLGLFGDSCCSILEIKSLINHESSV